MPETIIKVFVFGLVNIVNPSLNQIASKCEGFQPSLTICKNAIFKRLPTSAILLKNLFDGIMIMTVGKVLQQIHEGKFKNVMFK